MYVEKNILFKKFYISLLYALLFTPFIYDIYHLKFVNRFINDFITNNRYIIKCTEENIIELVKNYCEKYISSGAWDIIISFVINVIIIILMTIIIYILMRTVLKNFWEYQIHKIDEFRPYSTLIKRKYMLEWNGNVMFYFICLCERNATRKHDNLAKLLAFLLVTKRTTFLITFPEIILLWCYLLYSNLLPKNLSYYYCSLVFFCIIMITYRLFLYVKILKNIKKIYKAIRNSSISMSIKEELYRYINDPYTGIASLFDTLRIMWTLIK